MTNFEVAEALGILDRMLAGISACFLGATGLASFPVRNAVGDVTANAEAYLRSGTLAAPLLACFTQARLCGATFQQFNQVRQAILAETPVALIAVAVVQAGERFTLAQMCRILSVTTYVSRDDADHDLTVISAAFDPAEEAAADQHDTASYQALLALHASTVRDLAARSLLLPQIVNFSFGNPMPSLWLAQRIYQDGSRADEIVAENKVVHPAFCPRDLRCLSA